jgi:alpha-galactosidase
VASGDGADQNAGGELLVPGLPPDSVVEVPAIVDGSGLTPRPMEPLPEAIQAMLRLQASINKLLVEAYASGSRDVLLQALLLDPTTESYRGAVELIDRMCDVQDDVLPAMAWSATDG